MNLKRPTIENLKPDEALSSESQDREMMQAVTTTQSMPAFEALFDRHGPKIYRFILNKVKNPATAEELLQEVFLRVLRKHDGFRGEAKVTTWLFTIARNLSIDSLRRSSHRNHASLDQSRSEDSNEPWVERVASVGATPEEQLRDGQFKETLEAALQELPPEQAEVFVLREIHHHSFDEIASITNTPANTVKSRLRYALKALRGALQAHAPERREP